MILGIDPGKSGAIAAFNNDGRLIGIDDMPVAGGLISGALLDELIHNRVDPLADTPGTAIIEQVHAMPGQGVSSSFGFGRSLGLVEGVLAAQGWTILWVTPAKWKRALGLTADKDQSRRRALELWPDHANLFARKKDDGRAEAALIAHWHLTNSTHPAA